MQHGTISINAMNLTIPNMGEGITFGDMSNQCITKVRHLKQSSWHHMIDAPNKEEFFECMKKNDPKAAVVLYDNVAAYANVSYPSSNEV